jgi:oligoendopeptidase F
MPETSETSLPPEWDLSDLFSGLDDPAIDRNIAAAKERAVRFEAEYRGRIASADCSEELLGAALREYEAITRERWKPSSFAGLMFSTDTTDAPRGALLQRTQQEATAATRHLIFFDLEIGKIPEETFRRLVEAPSLAPFRHYLVRERENARHNLEEAEEKIIAELANTGVQAFQRLFSELTSRLRFAVTLDGEARELTQSEAMALLYDADRERRAAAAAAITATLRANSHPLTFIYNNLLQEKATRDRLRHYEYAEQSRHQQNEVSREVVDSLVAACAANYSVVEDYYRLKGRLLGLSELTHFDRYAPLRDPGGEIPFVEAREIVLAAFAEFSPRVREIAARFFDNGWIDARLRPGKRGGAFCSPVTPDLHPYVFMNYTGRMRDVGTLAHELGHALHGVLARDQHSLDFYPSLPMAETASVFAEMLVFERLQQRLENPADRLSLLAGKIEDTFATVFRQATMYRFELAAHEARRTEGELTTDRYNGLWQSTMQEMFGSALALGEDHAWWWLYIPHIFNSPFYVYAYAFGELLVLALYARYRQEGEPFVERYLGLLAAGGSDRPEVLLDRIGIDIRRREFWEDGIGLIREMVRHAEALAEELNGKL